MTTMLNLQLNGSSGVAEIDGEMEAQEEKFHIADQEIQVETLSRAERHPSEIWIGFVRDGRLRVRDAIHARLVQDKEGSVAVVAGELDMSGHGANFSDAVADLQSKLVGLFFSLEEEQNRLDEERLKIWEILRLKISRLSK